MSVLENIIVASVKNIVHKEIVDVKTKFEDMTVVSKMVYSHNCFLAISVAQIGSGEEAMLSKALGWSIVEDFDYLQKNGERDLISYPRAFVAMAFFVQQNLLTRQLHFPRYRFLVILIMKGSSL